MFYLGEYNELFVKMSVWKEIFLFKISMTKLEGVWKRHTSWCALGSASLETPALAAVDRTLVLFKLREKFLDARDGNCSEPFTHR